MGSANTSETVTVTGSDMALTKDASGVTVTPGGTVAYTINYANNGNTTATGITLSETVPANTTFNAGASTAGWSCANGSPAGTSCTLTIASLGGGTSGSATFAVTVVNPLPAGVTQLSNTASIADDGANGTDPTPANNSAADTTPVNAAPDLTLTKSDGGVTTPPGAVITYTLSYANAGNQNATGVALTEAVPANTTFNAGASTAGWSCANGSPAGTTCTFTVGNLAGGGASGTAIFAVTVVTPVAAGVTQINNTASVADDGANGTDPTPANNSAADTTPVNAAPDLTLTKSDGGVTVAPGDSIAYALSYANAGNQNATGVTISETVPANTTFNAGAITAGWSCADDAPAGTPCTLSVGNLAGAGASGSATFAVTVDNPVPTGVTQVSNTATIADDGSNGADPTPANNSAADTTPVTTTVDLGISKMVVPSTAVPGQPITYTLSFSATGNTIATNVTISDTLPVELTSVSFTSSGVSVTDSGATAHLNNIATMLFPLAAASPSPTAVQHRATSGMWQTWLPAQAVLSP